MVYKNFSKYDIDVENGVIYSSYYNKNRFLKMDETPDGYISCGATDDKGNKYYRLHQIIYCAVNGITKDEFPCDENGYRYEIHHKDNNKKNNHPSNLFLVSKKDQMNDELTRKTIAEIVRKRMAVKENRDQISKSLKNRADISKRIMQFSKDGKCINEYPSIMEAYRNTGIHFTKISECCSGKRNSAGGFKWRFVST